MGNYNVTIGMEVHCELKTESKMFSAAPNKLGEETDPNVSIDPVTTAQPGALPVPNRQAIRFVQMAGLALNCEIARDSKFDRKNYFYPDLPKGYQISQFDQPLCGKGEIDVDGTKIGITRIHMEEDTGKSSHPAGTDYSLVDLNRAGVPLMELVSEPDIVSAEQARAFCQKLQLIFRYLGISDADIEKGQMRCELNISLYKDGSDPLSGTKVEVKNIGSFRSVQKAAEYEIVRQSEILDDGGTLTQETRGWDDKAGKTIAQRSKENANDYRYFPEPDIPPMTFDDAYIAELRRILPELPDARRLRLKQEYKISDENLDVLIADRDYGSYFEDVASEIHEKKKSGEFTGEEHKALQLAANYLVGELHRLRTSANLDISEIKITRENYAELMCIIEEGKVNSSAAQTVLAEMFATGGDPSRIIDEKNLAQENDEDALGDVVRKVLAANPDSVADYKSGKENAIKYLMGQVMKETHGTANPQVVSAQMITQLTDETE